MLNSLWWNKFVVCSYLNSSLNRKIISLLSLSLTFLSSLFPFSPFSFLSLSLFIFPIVVVWYKVLMFIVQMCVVFGLVGIVYLGAKFQNLSQNNTNVYCTVGFRCVCVCVCTSDYIHMYLMH